LSLSTLTGKYWSQSWDQCQGYFVCWLKIWRCFSLPELIIVFICCAS